jgi:hypothetical protein
MSQSNLAANDGLVDLDYDSRNYLQAQGWPVAVDQNVHRHDHARDIAPLQTGFDQSMPADPNLMSEWQFQQSLQNQIHYSQVETTAPQFTSSFAVPLQPSPVEFLPASQAAASLSASGLLDGSYLSLSAPVEIMPFTYPEFQDVMTFPNGPLDLASYGGVTHNIPETSSPTDTYLEVRSLTSSSSDNGWATVDHRAIDPFTDHGMFINPTQTLHDRSLSQSSYSDYEPNRASWGSSWVDVQHPISSPGSDSNLESLYNPAMDRRISLDHASHGSVSPTAVSPIAIVRPIPVPSKKASSPSHSPSSSLASSSSSSSSSSPPGRKNTRKSPIAAKTAETKVRKQSQAGKPESEKRIGKRKGPLKPDQRKQASEIRKLRACLRCKFLKKTVSCFPRFPICISKRKFLMRRTVR